MSLWHVLRARSRLQRQRVALWYHPEYESPLLAGTQRVPHLQVDRAAQVLGTLRRARWLGPRDVRAAKRVSTDLLRAVHTDRYLEHVTHQEPLAAMFGLGADGVDVEALLSAQRRAVGGTVAAAAWAAAQPGRVALNLGGGFHHAHKDKGGGFCVYHDVAVAIAALRRDGFAAPIAIVDLDFHQDDGTTDIFAGDPSVWTYSIHGVVWVERDVPKERAVVLPPGTEDAAYLEALRRTLPRLMEAARPGLVFYLAGNDVLAGDPLGLFALSADGVLQRDRFVLEQTAGLPLCITLAGGYTAEATRAWTRLAAWTLGAAVPPEAAAVDIRSHYDRIARRLDVHDLQRDALPPGGDWSLDEDDVLPQLDGRAKRTRRFLGYYSAHGIELVLERYGLLEAIRRKGFTDLRVALDPSSDQQRVTAYGRRLGAEHRLIDLVVRRTSLAAPAWAELGSSLDLVSIEWLQLEDPTAAFSADRAALPGQKHPGLGLARQILELLRQACVRVELDGILFRPAHYHVAAVSFPGMRFLDAAVQGRFDALRELLAGMPPAAASFQVARGAVRLGGAAFTWSAEPALIPESERLRAYYASARYEELRAAAYAAAHQGASLSEDSPQL